jgi:hypothetical protein
MRPPRQIHRRTVLKTVGTGVIASVVSGGTVAAGGDSLAEELNTVRETTRKYRDVDVAERDGYGFFGVVPHAGVVYANPAHVESDVENLSHTDPPALLFYAPSEELDATDTEEDVDETSLVLAGVEWLVTPRVTDPTFDPDIFSDAEAARELKTTEVEGWHPFPDPNGPDVTGLHAWVHLANPNGVFARDHPLMLERISD